MKLTSWLYELPLTNIEQYLCHSLIGLLLFCIFNKNKYLRIIIPCIVGVGKESLDQFMYGGWDNFDLAATILPVIIISLLIKHPSNDNYKTNPQHSCHTDRNRFN